MTVIVQLLQFHFSLLILIKLLCVAGATVKMSSQYNCRTKGRIEYCFNGSKVVDGIYAPIGVHEWTSIAMTQDQSNPWLQIDLRKSFCISAVKIWNSRVGRRFSWLMIIQLLIPTV